MIIKIKVFPRYRIDFSPETIINMSKKYLFFHCRKDFFTQSHWIHYDVKAVDDDVHVERHDKRQRRFWPFLWVWILQANPPLHIPLISAVNWELYLEECDDVTSGWGYEPITERMEWCECLCEKQRHRQHLLELLSTGLKPLEVSTVTLSMKYLETFCSIIRLNNSSNHLKCNFTHAYALFFPMSFAQEHWKYCSLPCIIWNCPPRSWSSSWCCIVSPQSLTTGMSSNSLYKVRMLGVGMYFWSIF